MMQFQLPGIGQAQLHRLAADGGIDNAGCRFKGHLRRGNFLEEGKAGGAAAAVAAHLYLAAVGVEKTPAEIGAGPISQ